MKNILPYIFLLALLAGLGACKEKDEPMSVTVSDGSDLVINSIETATFGVPSLLEQSSVFFAPWLDSSNCGATADSSILKYYGGMAIQYNYTLDFTWKIICAGGTVVSCDADFHTSGNNASSLLSSTFTTDGDFNVSGVEPVTTEYVFNGTYTRNGNMTSKVRDKVSFDYVLILTISQLKMAKTTAMINSGSTAVTLNCTTSEGSTFAFSGTLTFNGNKNCVLVLNGESYSFQL